MKYRITSVSAIDGRPTTKSFNKADEASDVWHAIAKTPRNHLYVVFARMSSSGDFIAEVLGCIHDGKVEVV